MLNFNDVKWAPILEHPGYSVSSTGEIRSEERKVMNTATSQRIIPSKIKKPFISSQGYAYVQLYQNDQKKNRAVHQLVAAAFIPNPDNKPMVNHINGDKLNNNVCNLEWSTCSENNKHAWDTGLHEKHREEQRERMIGTKFHAKSKYHNVAWDAARNKWKAVLKHNGKMILQKRFETEIEAAVFVNDFIRTHGLNRPLNIIE